MVALLERCLPQPAERVGDAPDVAERPADRQALLVEGARHRHLATVTRQPPEVVQRIGDPAPATKLPSNRQRLLVQRAGQATIRAADGSELILQAATTIDVEEVERGADGALLVTVAQSRGLTVSRIASGRSAELRVYGPAGAVALLRRGGMVVRTDEGSNNVTVGCEDRATRVFFPYEDQVVPCEQDMMRTLTTDGDVLDHVVERGVPVVVAVFGGDQLGRNREDTRTRASFDHEEKEAVALSGSRNSPPPPPDTGRLLPPEPPNDAFASAQTLTVADTATADTRGATTQTGEPQPTCGPVGKTVWYRLTASRSESVTITTEKSTYDTVLAVYTGTSLASLTQVACNDQDPGRAGHPRHVGGQPHGDRGTDLLRAGWRRTRSGRRARHRRAMRRHS